VVAELTWFVPEARQCCESLFSSESMVRQCRNCLRNIPLLL